MSERFRRHMAICTILMCVLVTTILAGCNNNVNMGISEAVENAGHGGAGTQEPEILNDSEKLSPMKIYEGFLNGDLAVGRNGQQVHASDLFWDNDIEYCFFDIDRDGAEELHIRDGAVYYAVKVQDETPWIIFEGWWAYEPVIKDELCGILCYSHGYGSEHIEFIQVNAGGGMESSGAFY